MKGVDNLYHLKMVLVHNKIPNIDIRYQKVLYLLRSVILIRFNDIKLT